MSPVDEKSENRSLEAIRADIDRVDSELIRLLEQRVQLAREIGFLKGESNQPFFTPERERRIFDKLESEASGVLKSNQLISIFREIISAARAAERPMSIGYWGPEGTFSHQAVIQAFGNSVAPLPMHNIKEVFLAVERGTADYGVVPVENSTAGIVPETLDMFLHSPVRIVAETFVDVHHYLASKAQTLAEVKRIYAGPQPAAQCREWLRDHLPDAEIIDVVPTSRAAQKAVDDPEGAAIVNRVCLDIYELSCLAPHIQDHSANRTRFVVLGFNEPSASGSDKTSLMFKLKNRRGELYRVLGFFDEHEVNLTMIESRPDPRDKQQYVFYLDCEGHQSQPNVQRAINDLRSFARETVVLGSYPSFDEGLSSG
ncbi:prephenate dehydratase [Kamptonema cortianum]|nr:prephenate dehydratase [Kamptonema cortianum]